jgi:hypothetical protein
METVADSGNGREQVSDWPQGQEGVVNSASTVSHIRPKLIELAEAAEIAMEAIPPFVVRELKDANRGINKQ